MESNPQMTELREKERGKCRFVGVTRCGESEERETSDEAGIKARHE